jgi:hypothetical protein
LAHFSIISDTLSTQTKTDDLFEFMSDFNHFKHLLPEDKIENFECTSNTCSFSIKGLFPLQVKIKESLPKSRLTFETTGVAKFIFTLHIHFFEEQKTHVKLEGDMNPIVKKMVEKPLDELVNTMAKKLASLVI